MITQDKVKFCRACGREHAVRVTRVGGEFRDRVVERYENARCACGAVLSKDATSYYRSEAERLAMLAEIEVVVI